MSEQTSTNGPATAAPSTTTAPGAAAPSGDLKVTERAQTGGGPGHGPGGGMVGQKASHFKASFKRLLGRLAPQRVALGGILVLTIGSVALSTLGPKVLGHATDQIFSGFIGSQLPAEFQGMSQEQVVEALRAQGHSDFADMVSGTGAVPGVGVDFSAVGHTLVWVLGLYAVASLLALAAGWLLNGVVQATIRQLRADIEAKVHKLPLAYFDRQQRGELLSRATNDIDNLSQSLQQTLSQLLTSLLTIVGVLAMMIWISPLLAIIALISVPVSMVVAGQVMKRSQKLFVAQWRRTGALNGHVEETFSGHALVKVFGHQTASEQKFAEENGALYDASWKAQFISGLVMPIMMLVGNLNYVLVAVVGALRVASGNLSLGDVQAFIQYSRQFNQPLSQVASMANLLQSGVASAERVFELLDAPDELTPEQAHLPAGPGRGQVTFEQVAFSYLPDKPLISDLSLTVQPGQTVAIVGPTGAGKTTLVNLVMRFYDLTGGRILLDGTDVATVPRGELRARIGMVLQDTWLFQGTIAENIAYGRPEATREQVVAAARATFVDRFVHSLPDGYETVIDEEGSNLSAGERQLVTIARAFLMDPELLILDEATSSVDTRTELLLQQAMAALRADRTSFVIAHRLSTIRDADLILVMVEGQIVEQGTHEELIAAEGEYAALSAAQFAAAAQA